MDFVTVGWNQADCLPLFPVFVLNELTGCSFIIYNSNKRVRKQLSKLPKLTNHSVNFLLINSRLHNLNW